MSFSLDFLLWFNHSIILIRATLYYSGFRQSPCAANATRCNNFLGNYTNQLGENYAAIERELIRIRLLASLIERDRLARYQNTLYNQVWLRFSSEINYFTAIEHLDWHAKNYSLQCSAQQRVIGINFRSGVRHHPQGCSRDYKRDTLIRERGVIAKHIHRSDTNVAFLIK